ncbi:MAG: hypothetical protein ACK4VW_06485 [Anaerolineales bacterium]
MIILAVGMPRAASGWHYNLIHGLMLTAGAADAREICRRYHHAAARTRQDSSGAADAREICRRYHLQSILSEVNCKLVLSSLW